jgi:hypothetical protein
MKGMSCFATIVAMGLAAQPCAAAEDFREGVQVRHRVGSFAGATLNMTFDRSRREGSGTRLGLGIGQMQAGASSAAAVPAVELRLVAGKPLLLIGGQRPSSFHQRHGFAAGAALLAVGGLAAAALTVAAVSGGDDDEESELNRRQCFLPERELCGP